MANPSAADIIQDFVSLFFPNYCAGCEGSLAKGEQLICTRCILEMPRTNYHLDRENPFYQKLSVRFPVKYVLSFFQFVKAGIVQNVLHSLKYRNQPELGNMLGNIYGRELMKSGYAGQFDLVIPVPLHEVKRKRRGYNQSEEFGKGMAEALSISCGEHMKRLHQTSTQTKKNRLKRWQNVKEVFEVVDGRSIAGKRILLVDDVVTTGATLEAAGRVLLDNGCKELSIACIAATK